ncbi:MAG TPA: hypothetical protein VIG29_14920, partial [Vicinamibacteria bacterium]
LSQIQARLIQIGDEELRRSASLATTETFLERSRLLEAERERELADTREALHQLELAIERLDQGIERDRRQIAELAERRSQLGVEAKELEERRGPVAARLEAREKEEADLAQELGSREKDSEIHQERLRDASMSLLSLESSIEDRRGEIVHRISKIAALNNFLQGVLANSEKVNAELFKLETEVAEVDAERARLEKAAAEGRRELEAEQGKRERLSAEREALEARLERERLELQALDAELALGKDELSGLQARWSSLGELVAARAHFGAGARTILTRGNERGVEVLGSVADALDVEPGLERAAEAFLDSALQRVRVRGEEDVERALALLASENETSRSELLVESLARPAAEDLRSVVFELRARGVDGVVGVLSEGLRFVTEAPAAGLPDAVVVSNLEVAIRCYREIPAAYVSLGGEVVAPPGIVAIGPGGASAGLLATRRQIRELEEGLSTARVRLEDRSETRRALQAELAEAERQAALLRDQLHALEKSLVSLEHRASQLAEDTARASRKREVLSSEQSRAASERSVLAAKRTEMEAALEAEERSKEASEAGLESLRAEMSSRRDAVESLQSKAAEEQSRLAALRERRDALRLDVERLREGVAELTARVEASKSEEAGLAERDSSLKEDIERARRDLEASVRSRSERIANGRSLEAQVSILKRRIETTDSALKTRRRELEAVRERRSSEEVTLAREESDRDHLLRSFEEAHGISLLRAATLLTRDELAKDDAATQSELAEVKEKIDAIGPVNPMADEEYRELQTRNDFVTRQRQDLLDSISQTETAIGRIDRNSRQRFKEAFDAVNREFQLTFRQLFG